MMKTKTIFFIGFSVLFLRVNATVQIQELLIVDNDSSSILEEPLRSKLDSDSTFKLRMFSSTKSDSIGYYLTISSNCWRNYYGIWEIKDDSLFLIKINSCDPERSNLFDLETIFKNEFVNSKVFASWTSQTLNYVDRFDENNYMKNYVIENGLLVSKNIKNESYIEDNYQREKKPNYLFLLVIGSMIVLGFLFLKGWKRK